MGIGARTLAFLQNLFGEQLPPPPRYRPRQRIWNDKLIQKQVTPSSVVYRFRGTPAEVAARLDLILRAYPEPGYGTRVRSLKAMPYGELEFEIWRANSCE